jgi:hypothetical protein
VCVGGVYFKRGPLGTKLHAPPVISPKHITAPRERERAGIMQAGDMSTGIKRRVMRKSLLKVTVENKD